MWIVGVILGCGHLCLRVFPLPAHVQMWWAKSHIIQMFHNNLLSWSLAYLIRCSDLELFWENLWQLGRILCNDAGVKKILHWNFQRALTRIGVTSHNTRQSCQQVASREKQWQSLRRTQQIPWFCAAGRKSQTSFSCLSQTQVPRGKATSEIEVARYLNKALKCTCL